MCNNVPIVITVFILGFSFGGMLACCNTARIWKETCFGIEFLEKNVLCVTFGQPLLANPYVQGAIEEYPMFEKNIHTVYDSEDVFPILLRYLPYVKTKGMKTLTSNGNGQQKPESSQFPVVCCIR